MVMTMTMTTRKTQHSCTGIRTSLSEVNLFYSKWPAINDVFTMVWVLFYSIYSLYQKIDMENMQCLNEAEEGSGKTVFKPWNERLDKEKVA